MPRARTVLACLLLACFAQAGISSTAQEPSPMTTRATGTFEVKMSPQESPETPGVGRMLLDKQFHGDLEATAKGQMVTGMTSEQGSAGYVAIEQVTGKLKGRSGTFLLQHNGIMDRGKPNLSITVVPDSGTGELKGLTGKMDIIIEGGKHSYVFEYRLP